MLLILVHMCAIMTCFTSNLKKLEDSATSLHHKLITVTNSSLSKSFCITSIANHIPYVHMHALFHVSPQKTSYTMSGMHVLYNQVCPVQPCMLCTNMCAWYSHVAPLTVMRCFAEISLYSSCFESAIAKCTGPVSKALMLVVVVAEVVTDTKRSRLFSTHSPSLMHNMRILLSS
jgi:hypothetical protein